MRRTVNDLELGSIEGLRSLVRLKQFLSVGVTGAVCDTVVLVGLVEWVGLQPSVGKVGSAETAIVLMFVLNEYWTFSEAGSPGILPVIRRFLTSHLVRAGGAGTALVVLYVLHTWFGIWYLLANILGMVFGFFVNYVFESLVTWRVGR